MLRLHKYKKLHQNKYSKDKEVRVSREHSQPHYLNFYPITLESFVVIGFTYPKSSFWKQVIECFLSIFVVCVFVITVSVLEHFPHFPQKETFIPWLLPLILFFFMPDTHQSPLFFDTNFYFMYLLNLGLIQQGDLELLVLPSPPSKCCCAAAFSSGCWLLDGVRDGMQSLMHVCSCKCIHSRYFIQMRSDNMVLFVRLLSFSNMYTTCLFMLCPILLLHSFLLPNTFYL